MYFDPISEIEYFEETTKDTVKLTVHISFPIVIFSKIKVNVKEPKKNKHSNIDINEVVKQLFLHGI